MAQWKNEGLPAD
jgi:dynein heavy chain